MNQRTKVLVVSECYPSTETPQYAIFIEQQIFALLDLGYKIDVLVPHLAANNTDLSEDTFHGIRIYKFGYNCLRYYLFSNVTTARCQHTLKELVKRNGYDLIAVHITTDVVLKMMLRTAKAQSVKIVAHYHGLNVWENYKVSHPMREALYAEDRKRVLSKADGIVGVSNKVCDVVRTRLPNAKVFTVFNGVDIDKFELSQKRANDNKYKIVSVGNLIPIKGHEYILRAFKMLIQEYENIHLYLLGDGTERSALEALTQEMGIESKVHFKGYVGYDVVAETVREADMFVLPSYYEALGCAYLEAMACGVPTIGVEGQGIDEVIIDGENGLLAQPKNANSLYEKMKWLLDNPNLAKDIAEEGRRTAEHYTWDNSAKELDKVYRHLLSV